MEVPGPLGESAVEILESLPNITVLNGVAASKILEQGKDSVDSNLEPRLPEWMPDEPIADRVLKVMWSYLMTYRLADEEKIDETSVWCALCLFLIFLFIIIILCHLSSLLHASQEIDFSMMVLISHMKLVFAIRIWKIM